MSNNNINEIISNKENEENIYVEKENEFECLSTKEKEMTKISNNNTKRDPIYIMTLELEKGKPEQLKIYSDSNPTQLASDFCKEHNLDFNGMDYLRQKIEHLLNQKNLELLPKKKDEMKQISNPENINEEFYHYSSINNNNNNNNNKNNVYFEINENKNKQNNENDEKNYDLTSPKQKNFKNKLNLINQEKKYSYNKRKSSSKKSSHKYKARIQNDDNSEKIFDQIYQEIYKRNQNKKENNNNYNNKNNNNNSNKKNNNNILINNNKTHSEKINKNNNKIKSYKEYIEERNNKIKLDKEKKLFEIQKEINQKKQIINSNNKNENINIESKANSTIKKRRKNNYFNSKKSDNKISKILKEYEEKYSFQPSINENFKTDLTFEQRQMIYVNLYKKRKAQLRNLYLNSKKDEFGNIFFKPKLISKSKKKYNNEETKSINYNESIFQKNYTYWKKYNLDKEKLYKKYYANNKNEPIPCTKKQNEKIMHEAKMRAFKNLFKDLDGDQDNLINGINININKIPNNIYNIIEPLLNELKEDNQSLNQEEFIEAMNKLFEDISSLERRIIINIYSKKMKKNKSLNIYNSYLNNYSFGNNNKRSSTPNCCVDEKNRSVPHTNNNTNKLAFKHYKKISRLLDNIYKIDNKKYNIINLNKSKNEKTNENKHFGTENNKIDDNFRYICNCTFNNYIKKLN